jgi:hypothetical protein
MRNQEETQKLIELSQRLLEEHHMIGWLCTVHRNQVEYKGNPEATKMVQDQLDKANTLISLAYIWAILEENGFTEYNKWIKPKDRLELMAWKHIRHTGAHAPHGRAKRYFKEFEEFMEGSDPGRSGLKQNCHYTADSIDLADGMNYRFFEFAKELVKVAIGHCSNDNEPKD